MPEVANDAMVVEVLDPDHLAKVMNPKKIGFKLSVGFSTAGGNLNIKKSSHKWVDTMIQTICNVHLKMFTIIQPRISCRRFIARGRLTDSRVNNVLARMSGMGHVCIGCENLLALVKQTVKFLNVGGFYRGLRFLGANDRIDALLEALGRLDTKSRQQAFGTNSNGMNSFRAAYVQAALSDAHFI